MTPWACLVSTAVSNPIDPSSGFRVKHLQQFDRSTSAAFHPQLLEHAVAVGYPQLEALDQRDRLRFPSAVFPKKSAEETEARRLFQRYSDRLLTLGRPPLDVVQLDDVIVPTTPRPRTTLPP